MKKLLIILSALICASLAACGSTAQTSETSNSESVAMAEQVTDTPETEEITEEETEEITEEEPETEEKSNEVSDGLHASIQHEIDSPEWVRNLPAAQDENNKQLFVVGAMGMDKTTATVSMHERDEDGNWKQILSTPAFVGLNGMCLDEDHKEGVSQTPIGTYKFNKAFGIADDPGCAIPYIKVDDDTYWSGDEREGMHYNEMVDIKDFPDLDMTNSEHITDYEYQYQYCLPGRFRRANAYRDSG